MTTEYTYVLLNSNTFMLLLSNYVDRQFSFAEKSQVCFQSKNAKNTNEIKEYLFETTVIWKCSVK